MKTMTFAAALAVIIIGAGPAAAQNQEKDKEDSWEWSTMPLPIIWSAVFNQPAPASVQPQTAVNPPICTIELEDRSDMSTAIFTIAADPQPKSSVLYHIAMNGAKPEEVIVRSPKKNIEGMGAGLSVHPTPNEILRDYREPISNLLRTGEHRNSSGKLIWRLRKDSACSKLDAGLILFMINEWFLFG